VLDNRSELSDKLRDVQNAAVALISGIRAVSHSTRALAAQQAQPIERAHTYAPNVLHRCRAWQSNTNHGQENINLEPGSVGCLALPASREILWASEGTPRLAPRASTCNQLQILCRTSAYPAFCTFCCAQQPSNRPRSLKPVCSSFAHALSSLPLRYRSQARARATPLRHCESGGGCHSARKDGLSAPREELSPDVWVVTCPPD
jgi:hypothetical protein